MIQSLVGDWAQTLRLGSRSCVMPNRFDWNILEERIQAMKNSHDDIDTRSKALIVVYLSTMMNITVEDAVDAMTDGGNDRGVDAVYIDNRDSRNDIHFVQAKCVSKFENSRKNFPGTSVDKIVTFVADILNEDRKSLGNSSPTVSSKIADVLETQRHFNAALTIHFIGNLSPLVSHELDRIRSVIRRYRSVQFVMHDLDSLSEMFLVRSVRKLDRTFTVIGGDFFARTDLDLRGMVCTIAASEIVQAIKSTDNPHEVDLGMFDQNVRVYLKRKNRINSEIIHSALSDQNHMFWYQNNGITMTCDKLTVAPTKFSPTIHLKNVQIVNGGQTSHCLLEVAREDPKKIDDVLLLVRIIETSSEEIKRAISKSTNSQTPIRVRDLRANDRQQRQLELGFSSRGLFYERKSNQFSDQPKSKRIDAQVAAQAYLAYGVGMPEVAKKDSGRIFGDLYDTVFSEELTVERLLISHKLMRRINERKSILRRRIRRKDDVGRGELALIDGAFHIAYAVRQIMIHENRSLWEGEISDGDIDRAVGVVQKLYLREQERDESFSSNRLFKEVKTRDQIIRYVY